MKNVGQQLDVEFARLGQRSPWMASFAIDGRLYGAGLNHDFDVRPAHFFRLVPQPRRILELGSCQGGGTFQLAKNPAVREVVAIEGRAYNVEKAAFVADVLKVTNVRFLQGDLETFDLAALGKFDAVYCVGILYHLPHPWELLAKLAAVTNVVYLNTHYCPLSEANMSLQGQPGKQWQEFGYEDPLSGLSSWSFWPTLAGLATMLLQAGFVPEILEVDTVGLGQSPHGTTIRARRTETLTEDKRQALMVKMHRVLATLPATSGSLRPVPAPWWRNRLASLKRLLRPAKQGA